MNKTISLTAIAMVAVIMGMSAFAPAALAAPNENAEADVDLCHWGTGLDGEKGTEDDAWEVIFVHSQGSLNGHVDRHTDGEGNFDQEITNVFTAENCIDLNENGD